MIGGRAAFDREPPCLGKLTVTETNRTNSLLRHHFCSYTLASLMSFSSNWYGIQYSSSSMITQKISFIYHRRYRCGTSIVMFCNQHHVCMKRTRAEENFLPLECSKHLSMRYRVLYLLLLVYVHLLTKRLRMADAICSAANRYVLQTCPVADRLATWRCMSTCGS